MGRSSSELAQNVGNRKYVVADNGLVAIIIARPQAKCDAYLDLDKPCSRCRKMHRECIISEPFRREHKRKYAS
jgi:hypothetical protein